MQEPKRLKTTQAVNQCPGRMIYSFLFLVKPIRLIFPNANICQETKANYGQQPRYQLAVVLSN